MAHNQKHGLAFQWLFYPKYHVFYLFCTTHMMQSDIICDTKFFQGEFIIKGDLLNAFGHIICCNGTKSNMYSL